jgi:GDP-L-fucose synthase
MNKNSIIYIAGHRGLVGSAILRSLKTQGYRKFLLRKHSDLDLTNQTLVVDFFKTNMPEYVFLAAAKVGGILANSFYPADFIYTNLQIQANIIEAAHQYGVKRLLFLGSSCIYPRDCSQPIKEEYLMTGPLEQTNASYSMAKIAGIEICRAFNRQYGTEFLSLMPCNLYGPFDNYDIQNSHVLPALIRKIHEAKFSKAPNVEVWGTGKPKREFLHVDDLADACVFLMNLKDHQFSKLINHKDAPALVNIGFGEDLTIESLALTIAEVIGYKGQMVFNTEMPDGTPQKLLDISRLNQLGWKPSITLREGLEMTYNSYLKEIGF